MKRLDPLQYLTGFLMGVFFGIFAELSLLIPCGFVYTWLGRPSVGLAWWMPMLLIPIPLASGMITGKAIARMHLEDY
jgi:hypothetical protein